MTVLARAAVSPGAQGPLPGSHGTHFLAAIELTVAGFLKASRNISLLCALTFF